MNAFGFAWRSLVRQPARAGLAVLGVAAIGALLFDMLMLSQGLIVSMRDLLDRTGWDVRITATDDNPGEAPPIANALDTAATVAAVPGVRAVVALRRVNVRVIADGRPQFATLQGVATPGSPGPLPPSPRLRPTGRGAGRQARDPGRHTAPPWTLLRGTEPSADDEVVVNEEAARELGAAVGSALTIQAGCVDGPESLPAVKVRVTGVAEFPIEGAGERTLAGTLAGLERACGGHGAGEADVILVTSEGDAVATARAIRQTLPALRTLTNDQLLGRLQQNGFSYFRQISTVLTTVTLSFALLLITVLLTVSVNQRLGEIAALRALGFSRRRVVADVLSESALVVGSGGLLSLPLGLLLARLLDRILTGIPGLPSGVHFFVFEPQALAVHVALLVITAVAAALYPMRIVARLPIAATLREEVGG
jgi:putative ABC transport system permease protein